MTTLYIVVPGFASSISIRGTSVQIADATIGQGGGLVTNPLAASDQNISIAEPLYINLLGPAGLADATPTGTVRLEPGQSFNVPPGANVWVNAGTINHAFTAFFVTIYSAKFPPDPVPGIPGGEKFGTPIFPPAGVTGLTNVIPSYLYQEYTDDQDCQGFVDAQNAMQQNYVDTFNALNLPIYPGPIVAGKLLDWVAHGLYGFPRPSLSSGIVFSIGPLNTWMPNQLLPLNEISQQSNIDVTVTDDDTYRRCITWHFFKGDGKYFNTRWLKRRVWRFIYGINGTDPSPYAPGYNDNDSWIAATEQISITFGPNRECTIRFVLGLRTVTGGAMLNAFGCNGFGPPSFPTVNKNFAPIPLNDIESTYVRYPPLPYMHIFKEALGSGVLELPYQFTYNVQIG